MEYVKGFKTVLAEELMKKTQCTVVLAISLYI